MSNLPSSAELIQWLQDNPDKASKRDIAKAFGVKGADRIELKRMLRDLKAEGKIEGNRRSLRKRGDLPPVSVLRVASLDSDGDLWLEPHDHEADVPRIIYIPKKGDVALKIGDRVLARMAKSDEDDADLEARLIRRISSGPQRIVGIYRKGSEGGRIVPVDKKSDREWKVPEKESKAARDGELVEAEQIGPKTRMGLPTARIVDVVGDPSAPKAISLIAIFQHGIPNEFPKEALEEAAGAQPVELGDRTDLRELPLFTIDPHDARDHDDAICAILDDDPKNEGGFIVWVAIADVAHYVRPGSALDKEARHRGNSSYFPDRVVPMLPDDLSGDLCSLHEGVDRACVALKIRMNKNGVRLEHEFHRGLIRSPASLSYEQAQAAADGTHDDMTEPLKGPIADLFAAYHAASKERNKRQPLNLDLPERKIVLSAEGKVTSVDYKERFDAHKLVEEFMVMANVCAAETLEHHTRKFLYRVHEEPSVEKLDQLREVATAAGLNLAKGQVLKTAHINKLLDAAQESEDKEVINMSVLRSMTQAYYAPQNLGHFGLNLKRYAHFTSPIRRYADLIVHRALIAAHGWGDDGITFLEEDKLGETGDLISMTERRSMEAERDTNDRYLAAYLADRVGAEFKGRVSGIAKFGLFVRLDETGADGIVPLAHLGREYWRFNARENTLKGEDSGRVIAVGMPCTVELVDATAVTGGLTLQILSLDGKPMPKGSSRAKPKKSRRVKRRRK